MITDDTAAKLREAEAAGAKLLEQIVAGLDGVTGGEWCQFHPSYCQRATGTPFTDWDTSHDLSAIVGGKRRRIATFKHSSDAAHVDRLSPDNIRAIHAAFHALEAERDAEKARADAAEAERDKARAKLFPYADATEISGVSFGGKYLIGDKKSVSYFHEMMNRGLQIDVYKRAYDERIASAEETIAVLIQQMVETKDEAKVAVTQRDAQVSTISTLTAERDALKRERDEARAAHDGWNPIATCPIREPVDLWCVYGGEEYAQYEGGASIGKLVPNRVKTKEYGFFGNQSDNGVPQRDAPDLVPVAWRKAVPSCPAIIIAEALHIPITLEDARAVLARTGEPKDE